MKKLNGRPLHERIIVKLQEMGDMTKGGIFLPTEARETVNTAIVCAVGNLVNKEGENLQIGDVVIIMKHSGIPINIDGEQYQLLMPHDIHFVYESSKE